MNIDSILSGWCPSLKLLCGELWSSEHFSGHLALADAHIFKCTQPGLHEALPSPSGEASMHLLKTLHIKKAWAEYPAVSRSIIKAGIFMLCFNLVLEKKRRQPHAEDSSLAKPHIPPPWRKRKMVTIFYGNLLEDSFFFFFLSGNLEEVLKHSYGFHIVDIPSFKQNDSLRVALQFSSAAFTVTVW